MYRSVVATTSYFLLSVLIGMPSSSHAAGSDKTACKRVAKSAGLMSAVIDQACSGYKEDQAKCLAHVGRDGIPDLVRADNYMQCLCGQAKQALRSDASELCHASASIHGLLDSHMRTVQTAAKDTDHKQVTLAQREGSLQRLRKRETQAQKEAQKAEKTRSTVKTQTDGALARNEQSRLEAKRAFDQTMAKLRAAQRAAQQKFEGISLTLDKENAKLRDELAQAQAHASREQSRLREVNHAVSLRQREVGRARSGLATAIARERQAVERHRQSMDGAPTRTTTFK